jgi:hypothetical protein
MNMPNELMVVNKHHGQWPNRRYVYIGRPSPLGNPHAMGGERTREEVIYLFKEDLQKKLEAGDEAVINELERIGAMVMDNSGEPVCLVCFCAPKACHGDVIKKVIEEAIKEIA